jgi:predicted phage terminase large subunit-like protein
VAALAGLEALDLSAVDPESLTPEEREEADRLLGAIDKAETLTEFVGRVTPHHPVQPHMMPIIDLIEKARRRPIRACISMPPRHGKSETVFNGLCWWLANVPADTHAYLSYSDDQATSQSRKIRQRAQEGGVALSMEMANLSEWRTTSGGGLFASGVGGGLTGKGLSGMAVVDDPFSGPEQANSKRIRDAVWDWFTGVVMTRLEGASVLVVHTRWNQDDLIGRLAKQGGWEVLNLPAIAGFDDPLGRSPGEPLWPGVRPLSMLEEQRAIDAYTFEALYQGRPRPRGNAVFQKEPARYNPATADFTGWRFLGAGDPAATDNTSADFSALGALAVIGEGAKMRGRIVDAYRGQITVPEFADKIIIFSDKHGGMEIGIEAVGGFKALPQMLKRVRPGIRIREIRPLGDKFTRAQPVATAWNDGRIEVPTAAPWVSAFLEEIMAFTGVRDAHDDQVDWLAHAWNMASEAASPIYTSSPSPVMPRRRGGGIMG